MRAGIWIASAAVVVAMAVEARPITLAAIRGYRQTLSPLAARAGLQCRFTPTCSRYAEIVIARDGLMRGGWKAMRRIARCGPWTPVGTADPPP
jgi:putative membrane protein insertion efficiency factor